MRIAVITPFFPNGTEPYGGSPIYRTVVKLQELAEVRVLCPRARYPKWKVLQPRRSFYAPLDRSYSPPGVSVRWVEYPALPVVARPFSHRICALYLRPHLVELRPDLVLAYNVYPEGCVAVALARQLGLPIVLGGRGNDLLRIPDERARRRIREALQKADFLLTVSEDMRRVALELGAPPERTRTVPNGCDTSIFRPADRVQARMHLGLAADLELILFVGRLTPVKGLDNLLRAISRLLPAHPRLQLALIGDDWMGGSLQRLAVELGVSAQIRFLGIKKPPEVAEWLAACDVFCLPSLSEGCPNVAIEALSCGRPVVGSNVGGIPELLNAGCGIMVPAGDPDMLACALREAIGREWDEPSIASAFGRGWSVVAAETFEVCRSILKLRAS